MVAPPVSIARELQTEQHIAWLTLCFGILAGATAAIMHNLLWASGIVIGSVLGWLNLRWLRQGLDALVAASEAQAGAQQPRVPVGTYLRAVFRYALIAFTVYVIFRVLKVPPASMVVGLCALGPATLAASVYEITHPQK